MLKTVLFISLLASSTLFASSNYDMVLSKTSKIARKYKHLKSFVLGSSDAGKRIKGIIYQGSGKVKSNHLVVAAHHGNETLSSELAVKFIESIGKSGSELFKNKNIYIIPVLNITGFNADEREEKDVNGVSHDPNRDYPDPCIVKKNFNLKSTELLANFVKDNDVVGAITIHGYYGSLTYPWGIYTDNYETLDSLVFTKKAESAVKDNQYIIGTHADILYPAGGAFEDWAYYELGVWSLLVELENSPNYTDDISMLISSINSFPSKRSTDHRHLGSCTERKGLGISRP